MQHSPKIRRRYVDVLRQGHRRRPLATQASFRLAPFQRKSTRSSTGVHLRLPSGLRYGDSGIPSRGTPAIRGTNLFHGQANPCQ